LARELEARLPSPPGFQSHHDAEMPPLAVRLQRPLHDPASLRALLATEGDAIADAWGVGQKDAEPLVFVARERHRFGVDDVVDLLAAALRRHLSVVRVIRHPATEGVDHTPGELVVHARRKRAAPALVLVEVVRERRGHERLPDPALPPE